MTDQPLSGTGEVQPPITEMTFQGWVIYDPEDPTAWPMLNVTGMENPPPQRPSYAAEGRVVRRVIVTIPVEGP
jgi:hypothetical protein